MDKRIVALNMRLEVSQHDFSGHVQSLRNCFGQGVTGVSFHAADIGSSCISVLLNASDITRVARSDRGYDENAIIVSHKMGKQSALLSYTESWTRHKKKVRFESAGFRLYICPDIHAENGGYTPGIPHQVMRFEWESKNRPHQAKQWVFPAENAAHPHLQFDRCNIAFTDMQDDNVFEEKGDFVVEFAAQEPVRRHTDLAWFCKLHFPMQAPWSQNPYAGTYEDGAELPHANQPQSLVEINQWVSSVVRYVKEQFSLYMT